MLSFFARFLLALTSVSPVLGAMSISQYEQGEHWTQWIWFLVAGFLLVALGKALFCYMANRTETFECKIDEFERRDVEMVAFLLVYLLPFAVSTDQLFAREKQLTSLYVFGIISLAIAHAGAFHFNPFMSMFFGYHFYSIRNNKGVVNTLISRKELLRPGDVV